MTRLLYSLVVFGMSSCVCLAAPTNCSSINHEDESRLVAYVSRRYQVPKSVSLSLTEAVVLDNCYRRLVIGGKGPLGKVSLTLYLSPDLRYLSPELLDSSKDPLEEKRLAARRTLIDLTDTQAASKGSSKSSTVVVIFSDFQCPFCGQAAAKIKKEPLLQDNSQIRLVFRHFPLPQHNWAQLAAEAAACAQFQNDDAFWSFHDAIFANQKDITGEDPKGQLLKLAANVESLDQGEFNSCLSRQLSLGTVLRDKQLGERLNIAATPSIFVNGELIQVNDLHQALSSAIAGSRAMSGESTSDTRSHTDRQP